MIKWWSMLLPVILFFSVEIMIYLFLLLIRALKLYIRKNSNNNPEETTKGKGRRPLAGIIGIVIFNITLVILLVVMPYIRINNEIYYAKNVIICNQNEIDRFAKLLDDRKIEYEIIDNTKVKMLNKEDFEDAKRIVQENRISYSIVDIIQ